MATVKRPKVAQKIAEKIASFVFQMRTIILNVTTNPGYFSALTPAPATFSTDVDNLETAETLAKTRTTGSAAARDIKKVIVRTDVNLWANQVQSLADAAATETDAIAIISASGMGLRVHGVRVKAPIAVRNGEVSGTANLTAVAAGKRSANEWQMSPDGITWTNLPTTLQAKTLATGLTLNATVHFRHRGVVKTGEASWSQIVSLIIT